MASLQEIINNQLHLVPDELAADITTESIP